jgi:hypothetical protein
LPFSWTFSAVAPIRLTPLVGCFPFVHSNFDGRDCLACKQFSKSALQQTRAEG